MAKHKSAKIYHEFDEAEFLLLVFVALSLLTFVAWQAGFVPPLFAR